MEGHIVKLDLTNSQLMPALGLGFGMGAIFMVPSEQTLERQILARVTFAPELGFIDSG